jgi:hypothetical protein
VDVGIGEEGRKEPVGRGRGAEEIEDEDEQDHEHEQEQEVSRVLIVRSSSWSSLSSIAD